MYITNDTSAKENINITWFNGFATSVRYSYSESSEIQWNISSEDSDASYMH